LMMPFFFFFVSSPPPLMPRRFRVISSLFVACFDACFSLRH
jgi:hypothetical protein